MKTWTILICSYNCSKTIKKTLDSIVYKGNDDLDVFVVDDGSTENIYKIVKPFVNQYPNIVHYFRKENGNQGSCINFAIKHANSRFLSLLDSDDTYNKKAFNQVIKRLRVLRKDTDIVILNYKMYFLNGKKKYIQKYTMSTTSRPLKYKDFENVRMPFSKLITIHSSIYNLDLLKKCNPIPENVGYSDNVLYYEVLLRANNFAYLNKDIYLYNYFIRGNKQAIYLKNSIKNFNDMIKVLDRMLEIPLKEFGKDRVRVAKRIVGNHFCWVLGILGDNYNYSKDQKAEIVDQLYKKLRRFEKKNHVENQILPSVIEGMRDTKYGGAFFIRWLFKFVPNNFLKATRLNKKDRKEFAELTDKKNKYDKRVKAISRKHNKMIKKYATNKKLLKKVAK